MNEKLKKKKIAIVAILILIVLLLTSFFWWKNSSLPDETDPQAETDSQQTNDIESQPETDETDPQNQEGNSSGVHIVENEGDIEIIIPDDMDSDGF